MKKRYAVIGVAAFLFFAITVIVPAGPVFAQKKPILLRLVVPSPAGEAGFPLTTVNERIAQKFNERAKGLYKIEVHAGGALAKLPEYFDAVRVGAVEMAFSPWVMFNNLDPNLGALELPFLFASRNAAYQGINAAVPLYDRILQEKFNAKGLGAVFTGAIELFTTTKQIRALDDWKGLLTGALSPSLSTLVKGLGGSPVTIMWTDMYESLQKKVIDGATQASHGAFIMSFADVCKNATYFFGASGMNGLSINLDVWKKMPPDLQKTLVEVTAAEIEWFQKSMAKVEQDDLKAFKQKGVNVYFLPPAERAKWERRVAPTRDKQLAAFGDFGAKIKKIADEANRKYPYEAARQ